MKVTYTIIKRWWLRKPFRWIAQAANHEIIARSSSGYHNRKDAEDCIKLLKGFPEAPIFYKEDSIVPKKYLKTATLILIFLSLSFLSQGQSYVKVADKPEFQKFMEYCNTPVSRTFYMQGAVSLVKYNGYYTQPITGDWMAKYPLVIKWYPIGTKITTYEPYQQQIVAKIDMKVPRLYCTSQTEYITMFYQHWQNGDIQSGWWDSHFIGIVP
jgi:uncharacterized protein YegP (UPF0339 family)